MRKIVFSFFIISAFFGQFSFAMNEEKPNPPKKLVLKRQQNKDYLKQKQPTTVNFDEVLQTNDLTKTDIEKMLDTKVSVVHWYDLAGNQKNQQEEDVSVKPEIYQSTTNACCADLDKPTKNKSELLDKTVCLKDLWVSDRTLGDFFCMPTENKASKKKKTEPAPVLIDPDLWGWGFEDTYYYVTLPDGKAGNKTLYFRNNNKLFVNILSAFKALPFVQKNKLLLEKIEKLKLKLKLKLKKEKEKNKQNTLENKNNGWQLQIEQLEQAKLLLAKILKQQELEKTLRNRLNILFWNKHLLPIIVVLGIIALLFIQVLLWGIRQYFDLHPELIKPSNSESDLNKFFCRLRTFITTYDIPRKSLGFVQEVFKKFPNFVSMLTPQNGQFNMLSTIYSVIAACDITNKEYWLELVALEAVVLIGILCITLEIDWAANSLTNDWIKKEVNALT